MKIYFNIAKYSGTGFMGAPAYRHLFRTDSYNKFEADDIQAVLIEKFKAPEFSISRNEVNETISVTDLENS